MDKKFCVQCKTAKNLIDFNKNKRQNDGLQTTCKVCQKEYTRKNKEHLQIYYNDWLKNNWQIKSLSNKKYRQYHKEYFKSYQKEYRSQESFKKQRNLAEKELRKKSPLFAIKNNLRRRINSILNGKKKSKSTEKLLGCSYKEFIIYLEQQFTDGMNWENYGLFGWHIDHIVPLSSAQNQEQLEKLCHYTNLQPLWAKDNLSKGSKII